MPYRENEYVRDLWSRFNVLTREHFYHVGGKEENRNPMIEALITNFSVETRSDIQEITPRVVTARAGNAFTSHQQSFDWF